MHKVKRYILTYKPGPSFEHVDLSCPTMAREFCIEVLSRLPIEKALIVALDSECRLIGYDYSIGTPFECNVYFQRVFSFLLSIGADSFIVAHNHPSFNTAASREDLELRDKLRDIGPFLDIPMSDCFIVAGNKCRSILKDKRSK
jgi:DNA repair protein RadC